MGLHRITLPFINAFFITAVLLYLMFLLVKADEPKLLAKPAVLKLDWVRIPEEEPPLLIEPKPEPIVEPFRQPEIIKPTPVVDIDIQDDLPWTPIDIKRKKGGIDNPLDSQLVLALGYPPSYPQNLANRGVEGYVVVGFSVSAAGAVYDSFIIESEPEGAFDRSALKAIAKFKYKAKMSNGKPVSASGQRYMFRYELDAK